MAQVYQQTSQDAMLLQQGNGRGSKEASVCARTPHAEAIPCPYNQFGRGLGMSAYPRKETA